MRVVSLVPSTTETLIALGVMPIACTRFCEQPGLPTVGGTKNPDVAAIVALQPDLVVVDTEENRREDAEALTAAGVEVLVTEVRTVAAALDVPAQLAAAVGADAPPVSTPRPAAATARLRAFVPIWRRPWMSISAATYGASLLEVCGIELVTADSPVPYPQVELDTIAASRPDLVLVPSEPYEFRPQHLDELAAAFADAAIHRVDGQDLFWWGSRTAAAIERIANDAATW